MRLKILKFILCYNLKEHVYKMMYIDIHYQRNCLASISALQIYVRNVKKKKGYFIMFVAHVKKLENFGIKYLNLGILKINVQLFLFGNSVANSWKRMMELCFCT